MPDLIFIGFIIFIALIFDFGNGLNDAANSIATVVGTRVMSMRAAVIMAALGNFIAAFLFTTAVATTIGKGLIKPEVVNEYIILSGLLAAIFWVYLTTHYGIPISASHALIGGFIGAAIVAAGLSSLIYSGILKVVSFVFIAPILGFIGAFLFSLIILHIFKKKSPEKVNKHFKRLQIISAFTYSLSHGTNDAQKTMGIIAILLFSAGYLGTTFHIPLWVILISHATIALGTLLGGWRVIKTVGTKITKLRPVDGFSAETSGAATVISCTLAGIPVSTTHVISGSVMGVGSTKRLSKVRWSLARNIVWAWIITLPISAIVGALSYLLINFVRTII